MSLRGAAPSLTPLSKLLKALSKGEDTKPHWLLAGHMQCFSDAVLAHWVLSACRIHHPPADKQIHKSPGLAEVCQAQNPARYSIYRSDLYLNINIIEILYHMKMMKRFLVS